MAMLKARVLHGRYAGETVRVSNVSTDDSGHRKAACIFSNGQRANILVTELEIISEESPPESPVRRAKTASMPFISGSSSSRTLTHTKNMNRPRKENSPPPPSQKLTLSQCEICQTEYNLEDRRGRPGKVTHCENCAEETENKVEGQMIFSHKTGATIEIKKDGELRHEADTFDPKNR